MLIILLLSYNLKIFLKISSIMVSIAEAHSVFKENLPHHVTAVEPKYLYTEFINDVTDEALASEKLSVAYRNIEFLQKEHAITLSGLHKEIEKLQNRMRELRFNKDVLGIIAPENEFFNCDVTTLQEKVDELIQDNRELKKKLQDSNHALEALDQKQKLEQWQHHQELEEKDKTIMRLQRELEIKCSTVAELTAQLTRKKKGSFLRRFSLHQDDTPSVVDTIQNLRNVDPDAKDTAASSRSLPTAGDSPLHSINYEHSSYSSLSDKSISDDDVSRSPFFRKQYTFPSPKYGYRHKWWGKGPSADNVFHLPPIKGLSPKRPLVRQQLRVDKMAAKTLSDPLAIDNVSLPELVDKRISNV